MKGILFTPDNIKAIVEGKKTQTRRVISPQPELDAGGHYWNFYSNDGGRIRVAFNSDNLSDMVKYARYQVGEVVYIKEAWCEDYLGEPIHYKADGGESPGPKVYYGKDGKWHDYKQPFWRSPLFMPAWAARYFIKITAVRTERLQEITINDCKDEGIKDRVMKVGSDWLSDAKIQYAELWDSINPKHLWSGNWWVFRYEFKKVAKP